MMMGTEAQIAVIERAFRAVLPAFVLFHQRDAVAFPRADNALDPDPELVCLIAHGIEAAEAKAFMEAKASDESPADGFLHFQYESYHLLGVPPAAGCAEGGSPGASLELALAQFELAAQLLQQARYLQRHLEERNLVADALDSLPLSIFVLDRDRRYI